MSKKKKVKYDMSPYNDYANYLQGVDTSNVDNTLSNLTANAYNQSQQLGDMGDYTFSVDGSDEARQRAEDALYNSVVDKLTPQFERQQSNLATMLQNQGIPVGSEAYSRAMGDLEEKQNDTLSQAAYQAVLGGQDAFSQSLGDEVTAGGFGNTAQQAYINQLLSQLQGSASGYENQQNLFAVRSGKSDLKYAQDKANAKSGLTGALTGALQGGLSAFAASGGNPYAGLAGAAYGGYQGYNSNPYGR
jgi:hypothetical protein